MAAHPVRPPKKKKRRARGIGYTKADAADLVEAGDPLVVEIFEKLFARMFPDRAARLETAKAEVAGVPWEYFSIDDDGPFYHDAGFPPEATIGTVDGYAVTATDPEGTAHAHALGDGNRDEILRSAAQMAASETCFVAVGRAMGVIEGSTVYREIATFKPVTSKDEGGGREIEIEIDEDEPEIRERRVTVTKTDDELQIVYGEVYAPIPFPDSHGEVMSAREIEKMAHGFLASGRVNKIDTSHDNVETGSVVVESFIADEGSEYITGAWVVGVHVPSPDLWRRIKSGELNGFSMQALVHTKQKTIEVDVPDEISGQTEEADNDDGTGRHRHTYKVTVSDAGEFSGGSTGISAGHGHDIRSMSVTDFTRGRGAGETRHRHRYSFLDKLFGGPLDAVSGRQAEAA